MYHILTMSDETYYPFVSVLIKSILANCNLNKIKSIRILDTGLAANSAFTLLDLSPKIKILPTHLKTSFSGGVWGADWQSSVRSKTTYLQEQVAELCEPLLLLDSDMMVIKDLADLFDQGGDIQVCVRPRHDTPFIGSYFFAINPQKALPFISDWEKRVQQRRAGRAPESPSLVETVYQYQDVLNIVQQSQTRVNVLEPKFLADDTYIVHFKGGTLSQTSQLLYKSRIDDRGWSKFIEAYV